MKMLAVVGHVPVVLIEDLIGLMTQGARTYA